MSHQADPTDQERLFLIRPGGPPPASDFPAQPARFRRPRQKAVDNVPPPPTGWTPSPWPDLIDHEVALAAHARRVRVGSVVTTGAAEL